MSEKITIGKTDAGFSVLAGSYRATVDVAGLCCRVLSSWSDEPLTLHLAPLLDGKGGSARTVSAKVRGCALEMELEGEFNSKVGLEFLDSWLVHRCAILDGPSWGCLQPIGLEGKFRQVRNFDPDLACFDIPRRIKLPVQISSALQTYRKFFQLDWGNYMIPPYLLALHDGRQYVGVGLLEVPDCPMPFDGLVSVGGFELKFDYGKAGRNGAYAAVPVGIYFGQRDADILWQYGESARSCMEGGGEAAPRDRPDWWSGPIYTTWGDQVYRKHYEQGRMAVEAGAEEFLSAEMVDAALARLAEEQILPKIIVLDEGWSVGMGDWRGDDARFGGSLAAYIVSKQRKGYRIVLHFNPFLVAQEASKPRFTAAWKPRADFLLRDSAGRPKTVRGLQAAIHGGLETSNRSGRDYFLFDWSQAECRDMLLARLAAMVGGGQTQYSALGGPHLNADGIKLSGTKFALPPDAQVAEPSYGQGERYLFAVIRDIHRRVKSVKDDAVIFLNCLNPLFGPHFDIVRAGNTSEVNHDLHVLRAAAASWLMPAKLIDTDDWAAYAKAIGATTFIKAVAGIPDLFSAFYRGDGRVRVGGAAGGHPMKMTGDQYRVISAAWKMYELAEAVDRGRLNIDYDRTEFSTAGSIDSPPFLRTYQGGNVLAAYTAEAIYVASLLDDKCVIDLPEAFEIGSFERIDRFGGCERAPCRRCLGDKLIFDARSSREDTFYYRVVRKQ